MDELKAVDKLNYFLDKTKEYTLLSDDQERYDLMVNLLNEFHDTDLLWKANIGYNFLRSPEWKAYIDLYYTTQQYRDDIEKRKRK